MSYNLIDVKTYFVEVNTSDTPVEEKVYNLKIPSQARDVLVVLSSVDG